VYKNLFLLPLNVNWLHKYGEVLFDFIYNSMCDLLDPEYPLSFHKNNEHNYDACFLMRSSCVSLLSLTHMHTLFFLSATHAAVSTASEMLWKLLGTLSENSLWLSHIASG